MEKNRALKSIMEKGLPAVCVPLTGRTAAEVLRQAEEAAESEADIAEWRADLCKEFFDKNTRLTQDPGPMLSELRKRLGDKALLFTVRTEKEGGEAKTGAETYEAILRAAMEAGAALSSKAAVAADGNEAGGIDMIDIEMSAGEETVGRLVDLAKKEGIISVISCHDFERTPPDEELEALAENMEKTGADIVKIAVMPRWEEDVERFCALADKIKKGLIKRPCILISMGEMGKKTRTEAEELGSVMTFGALTEEQASAPGQITVSELKKEILRRHRP